MTTRLLLAASGLVLEALLGVGLRAEPIPRPAPVSGSVVSTRLGEEIDLVGTSDWRGLEVLQDVKPGDTVRTNAFGQIAILFADQTQLRLGRNSSLLVHGLGDGEVTRLELTRGQLFGRTPRGGSAVEIETPAATAAIRGTDWTLSVDGDESTLLVLDGAVEFSNPRGAVTVAAGEAARATLGQAPSKVVVVASDVREQMLINLSLRGAFAALAPVSLAGPALRAEGARLAAIPSAQRGAQDRVVAAEVALEQRGRQAALEAVAAAREVPLTREQAARVTLVEAIVAGSERRYAEAARLFQEAEPGLRGERATAARYQAYFARSLADPTHALSPPVPGDDRVSVVGEAIIAAFLDSPGAAYRIMAQAAPRFQTDAVFQASLAEAALLAGEYDAARIASDRASALDPDDPDVLSTRSSMRAAANWDLEGARSDLKRALEMAPASADLWGDLALIEDARGATRDAEAAYRRAIMLDPEDPVAHANYAILLLDQNRLAEADVEIDAAFAADPSFELGYFARGRHQLQGGDDAGAIESLLRATTANPAYSNGLLLLGAAYAEQGDFTLASQALDNAARLDKRDPTVSQYRSSLATFQFQADGAIRFAQDSVRQTRARGGDYASVAATRAFGSTLGGAYRSLSLNAWGEFWGDAVFTPFDAGGYFDRSIQGARSPILNARAQEISGPDPVMNADSFSDLLQGLLLDPLALVGPDLRPSFARAPFTEVAIGAGPNSSDGDAGYNATGTFQSLGSTPIPYSLLVSGDIDSISPSYAEQDEASFSGLVAFGLQPTANDRIVGFANGGRRTGGLAFDGAPLTRDNSLEVDAWSGFVGWSHTFGFQNVTNVAATAGKVEQDNSIFALVPPEFPILPGGYDLSADETTLKLGVGQLLGLGRTTLRFGIEVGEVRDDSELGIFANLDDGETVRETLAEARSRSQLGRLWIDALTEVTDGLRFEGALFGTYLEDAEDETLLAPRLGLAWTPAEGHWLRAGFLRERPALEGNTLAPTGLLGVDPIDLPPSTGRVDTTFARWDAEWSPRVFTAVEYQHQDVDDLSIPFTSSLVPITAPEATLDQLSLSGNLWIHGGFGAFGTLARNWSDAGLTTGDGSIPFVPDVSARFGLTHVNPRRFTITLAETYLGDRDSADPAQPLSSVWTADLTGSWVTENRRIALTAGIFNLFDADYEIAPEVAGVGRTLTATLTARF